MGRKITQRERIVAELAAIREVQRNPPSFFRDHDHRRLADAWTRKSAALIELELVVYERKMGR